MQVSTGANIQNIATELFHAILLHQSTITFSALCPPNILIRYNKSQGK